jgi:thiopurine S-methyltransferase
VQPGGVLAGYFFFDEGERGPPFPLHSQEELVALLEPAFERIEDAPVADSIPVFAGRERWQVWRRKVF